MLNLRNKFDTLQETCQRYTPVGEFENFFTVFIKAAAKSLQTKLMAKKRVPWELLAVRELRDNLKKYPCLVKET